MLLTYTELLSYSRRWSKMTSITDSKIYISYVFDTKYCWFSIEIEYTSMNCYARRNMNFALYKEFLNPCRLKRLQFTFRLFHKFSTQDKGIHVFISKGNNLPTIAQCKFKNVFYSHTRSYVSLNYYNAGDSQDSSFTSLCTHYKFISVFHNFKPKTINVVWK